MSKINLDDYYTIDKYEGCHPVIAEALRQGKAIECRVWDHNEREPTSFVRRHIVGYFTGVVYPYATATNIGYKHAEPIRKKTKKTFVKKASEIMRWLEDNGAVIDAEGDWRVKDSSPILPAFFVTTMWQYCGEEPGTGYNWHPDWLEEKEI